MTKISIIIPVYNVEKYLRECLDSCVNQTLEDIEIICVDDCSPDNSIKILEEYQAKDSRIKIFRHETNKNLGAARNTGLANATGEYVWFVDSDDYIDTKACQILYDAIKEFNVDMLCFSALRFSEMEGMRYFFYDKYYHQGVQINKIYSTKANWKEITFSNLNVTAWAYVTKTSVVQKFRFREGIWHEDTDFTPILLASVDSFCYIPYTAYFYRASQLSITQTPMSQKRLEDYIAMLQSLDDFVTKNRIKRGHFLFNFLIGQTNYITGLCKNNAKINPNNFDKLVKLQTKYRKPKYSLKRFIRKIFRKMVACS
ncbi:glycosyltransferase family 2 protein [bacterium]|nr:glycosyltransferase family 2 protein [bacterium]